MIHDFAFCHASGIQLESAQDVGGGLNIGYVDDGDWMTYNIDMAQAGEVTVTYRVASAVGGGVLQIEEAGGANVYGSVDVPNTGDWQNWVDITHTIQLPAGSQTIGISAPVGGWNLNGLRIDSNGSCGSSSTPDCNPEIIRIQTEVWAQASGVQTENTSDVGGGLNVGWIDANDWMTYNITLPNSSSGLYTISYRVASQSSGGEFKLEQPGGAVEYGRLVFGATGGWQQWTTVSHTVSLPPGTSQLAIAAIAGGWNINWFDVKAAD